jgi:hypothetical protein
MGPDGFLSTVCGGALAMHESSEITECMMAYSIPTVSIESDQFYRACSTELTNQLPVFYACSRTGTIRWTAR